MITIGNLRGKPVAMLKSIGHRRQKMTSLCGCYTSSEGELIIDRNRSGQSATTVSDEKCVNNQPYCYGRQDKRD